MAHHRHTHHHERRRGRVMDPSVDAAILAEATRLLHAGGLAALSIDAVAKGAGVARTTVYRRYPDRLGLAVDAIADMRATEPLPDTGSARGDLEALLTRTRDRWDYTLIGSMMVEEARYPELVERFRTGVVARSRQEYADVVAGGVARGELPEDADPELVNLLVTGAWIGEWAARGGPDEDWPRRTADRIWGLLGGVQPQPAPQSPAGDE